MNALRIVNTLLEAGVDDPKTFLRHFEPSPLDTILMAYKEARALPNDDNLHREVDRITNEMVTKLEQLTGREALNGARGLIRTWTPMPWDEPRSRKYVRSVLSSFIQCSKRVKK